MSTYTIEKDWQTKSGLRAVAAKMQAGHLCGYVAVNKDHPAFGKDYSEQLDIIKSEDVNQVMIGKKSPIVAFTATVRSDGKGKIRRSLDILIDVHGGLTYSGPRYPMLDDEIWWFGFDCAHCDDHETPKDLDFVVGECESMAEQLSKLKQ